MDTKNHTRLSYETSKGGVFLEQFVLSTFFFFKASRTDDITVVFFLEPQ